MTAAVCPRSPGGNTALGPLATGWAAGRIVPPPGSSCAFVSGGAEFGDLIVGAEPAHEALGFLLRALLVQGDEAGEDFGLRQVGRPAIGGSDGCIQFVVVFVQDADEAIVEDAAVGGGEVCGRGAGPEFFQHVVEAGQRQVFVLGQDPLAVGVEALGDLADAVLLQVVCVREWKRVEAAGFRVTGIVADAEPSARPQRPGDMMLAGKDTKRVSIV